jgi:BlaI family transcriptional regulator, penicillinase repressor
MAPQSFEAGPLEMRVLGILDGRASLGVSEIQAALRKAGSDLAYTTVMTVLVRLHQKGFVKRKKEGRQFLYSVAGGRESASGRLFERVRHALFHGDRLRPILALLDGGDDLTVDELQALRQAVDDKLKGLKEKR